MPNLYPPQPSSAVAASTGVARRQAQSSSNRRGMHSSGKRGHASRKAREAKFGAPGSAGRVLVPDAHLGISTLVHRHAVEPGLGFKIHQPAILEFLRLDQFGGTA